MIVNDKGQIVGDDGLTWAPDPYGNGWRSISPGPGGYHITPSRSHLNGGFNLWELVRVNDGINAGSTAHVYILASPSVDECKRAAEIHWIRRIH